MNWLKLHHSQSIFAGIIVMSMVSPPIANLLEVLLIVGVSLTPSLRQCLTKFSTTLDFKIQFAFMVLLMIGFAYPLVEPQTYAASILSWRKFLLLPLGYVLFSDNPLQKRKAIKYIFYFILLLTLIGVVHKSHLLPFFNESAIRYQIGTTSSESMFVAVALAIVLSSLVQKTNLLGVTKATESLLAMYLVGYVALFTTGRSGYLAMMIVLIFMAYKYLKGQENKIGFKTLAGLFLVVIISAALLMSSKTSADRINQALTELQHFEKNANDNNVTSIGQRINFWKNTLEMIPRHYLTGAGTGSFQAAYTEQVKDKTGMEAAITQDPHNQYMKILIEQGIVGLMLFLCLIYRALYQPNSNDTNYVMGSAVIFIWTVTSCFNAHFSTFMEGTFIWAWMGLMNRYQSNR
ncbi:MAG: O-antigen ligase family protein [Gammaproteobacteria bacterium]|nr:O-antigen ligase family protein [Gammaproteobacteria bacterium]